MSEAAMRRVKENAGQIESALRARGHDVTIQKDPYGSEHRSILFPSTDAPDQVSIGLYIRVEDGKGIVRLSGDYRMRPSIKTFREPKSGFRFRDIAACAVRYERDKAKRAIEDAAKDQADVRAHTLRRQHGLALSGFTITGSRTGLRLVADIHTTEAQIAAMVEAARACGLIPSKGEIPVDEEDDDPETADEKDEE